MKKLFFVIGLSSFAASAFALTQNPQEARVGMECYQDGKNGYIRERTYNETSSGTGAKSYSTDIDSKVGSNLVVIDGHVNTTTHETSSQSKTKANTDQIRRMECDTSDESQFSLGHR